MKNFTRPAGEKPYYYSSTVVNDEIVYHEGEEKHAMYLSEMREGTKRANLWHKWVEKNVPNAYDSLGCLDHCVVLDNETVYQQFLDGERIK